MLLPLTLLLVAAPPGPIDQLAADRGRIQRHLAAVEAELRARDPGHLPPDLQRARRDNLDRLHAYRLAGIFPRNSGHPGERVPYFIDDDGVLCAVGHLVVESGFGDVAREIQDRENNARLLSMQHPALPTWIAASGLTADECALIQPAYCRCGDLYEPVCGVDGLTYQNSCYAVDCAGVEIAHTGICKGEDSTGDWPDPGTSTGAPDPSSTTDDSTTDDSTTDDPTTDDSTTRSTTGDGDDSGAPATTGTTGTPGDGSTSTGEPAPDTGTTGAPVSPTAAKDGCDCRSTGSPAGGLLLALLALLPRRRRGMPC